jgi:amylosucrase
VYNYRLHHSINARLQQNGIQVDSEDNLFFLRLVSNASAMHTLFLELYGQDPAAGSCFDLLIETIIQAYLHRPVQMRQEDLHKEEKGLWFLSNQITGMSLYVDRFSTDLGGLATKLDYCKELGVNLLHLMPIFQSPPGESDGGYAVSDFRTVERRFGTLQDLERLRKKMGEQGMYLMLDIVLNHTSHRHAWAEKAKQGDPHYQGYYYMYDDRTLPDQFERFMPEIFPQSAPGNFTYVAECNKWAMTVFHRYQWDLNYRNPRLLVEMLDNVFFYANLGVDILRIDAPAFIWKQIGTTCQNLPQAHTLLRLIKQCVQTATPGMALLGEAIVAPSAIMKYFGTGGFIARECDLAYNATQMALQWDALATADTKVMLAAQHEILQKPFGCSWITYTRCHDDIGLGYEDYMIEQAGYRPLEHRKFLQDYYTGHFPGSDARGALFSVNPKTQDARISGTLASLCGLEQAIAEQDQARIGRAVDKILLMQAQSFFLGGIPMIFYGDEVGYTNDYGYLQDPAKNYDNRWMHRPLIHWDKNQNRNIPGKPEQRIFSGTRRLNQIRKMLPVFADLKNLTWMTPHNIHVAGWLRSSTDQRIYCLFNFSGSDAYLTWFAFKEHGKNPVSLYDVWEEKEYVVGSDQDYLVIKPYRFLVLEARGI